MKLRLPKTTILIIIVLVIVVAILWQGLISWVGRSVVDIF